MQSLQSQGQNPQFQKNINNPALMNPQMFQQHQQQQGLSMNPQQLLNGRGGSAMTQQQLGQSLNPAMLLQMQGGNAMQANNMGGGMNGVNQGALGMGGMGNMANPGVAGMGNMNANAMGFNPQQLAQLQQQMNPQQMDARQMQAKLSVSIIKSDVSTIANLILNLLNLFALRLAATTTRVATTEADGTNEPGATTV